MKVVDTHPSLIENESLDVFRAFQERQLLRVTLTTQEERENANLLLEAMITYSSPAGKQLGEALSLHLPLGGSLWESSILGIVKEGKKYFVLDTLKPST